MLKILKKLVEVHLAAKFHNVLSFPLLLIIAIVMWWRAGVLEANWAWILHHFICYVTVQIFHLLEKINVIVHIKQLVQCPPHSLMLTISMIAGHAWAHFTYKNQVWVLLSSFHRFYLNA